MKNIFIILSFIFIFSSYVYNQTTNEVFHDDEELFIENIKISGQFRNDLAFSRTTNEQVFSDVIENKFVITKNADKWKFYSDLRLYLFFAEASKYRDDYEFTAIRAFIRYYSNDGNITIGKTYINLGTPVIFNLFEMNKRVMFSDLNYDKAGRFAMIYDYPLGNLSNLKLYVSPEAKSKDTSFGLSRHANSFMFDYGFVVNRKAKDQNLTGIYMKGDAEVGLLMSWAYHFNDNYKKHFNEANVGFDYSISDLYMNFTGYYNEKGNRHKSNYTFYSKENVYFTARYYLYNNFTYTIDEFISIKSDIFINMIDYSGIVTPSIDYVVSNGFKLIWMFSYIYGKKDQEFSRHRLGEYSLLLRAEVKL